MYTINGFTISTKEQARTMLFMAMIKKDVEAADKAAWILKQMER